MSPHLPVNFNRQIKCAINIVQQSDLAKFITGKEHLLTIEFDRAIQQQTIDFRPYLPLQFRC